MEDIQGYSGSHWRLPLGNYLLHIAPADARVTGKTTKMGKDTLFAGHFNDHGNALWYSVHCPIEVVQGYKRKPLDANIGQVLHPIVAMGTKKHRFSWVFFIVTRYRRG